jgi:hypothetical protein
MHTHPSPHTHSGSHTQSTPSNVTQRSEQRLKCWPTAAALPGTRAIMSARSSTCDSEVSWMPGAGMGTGRSLQQEGPAYGLCVCVCVCMGAPKGGDGRSAAARGGGRWRRKRLGACQLAHRRMRSMNHCGQGRARGGRHRGTAPPTAADRNSREPSPNTSKAMRPKRLQTHSAASASCPPARSPWRCGGRRCTCRVEVGEGGSTMHLLMTQQGSHRPRPGQSGQSAGQQTKGRGPLPAAPPMGSRTQPPPSAHSGWKTV